MKLNKDCKFCNGTGLIFYGYDKECMPTVNCNCEEFIFTEKDREKVTEWSKKFEIELINFNRRINNDN